GVQTNVEYDRDPIDEQDGARSPETIKEILRGPVEQQREAAPTVDLEVGGLEFRQVPLVADCLEEPTTHRCHHCNDHGTGEGDVDSLPKGGADLIVLLRTVELGDERSRIDDGEVKKRHHGPEGDTGLKGG